MRVCLVVFFSLSIFALISGLPAPRHGSDDVEVVSVDANPGNPGGPWPLPFDSLFSSFASVMARLRQQMEEVLRRTPIGNRTAENSPFPVPPFIPNLDLGKGNTTSVTKLIDGHKVVINETEYKHADDFGGSFVRVRIIDVQPDSSELTTEKDAEEITTKDTESVENSHENEISKNRDAEVFNSIDSTQQPKLSEIVEEIEPEIVDDTQNWAGLETFSIEDNDIESNPAPDLSRDIYVNQIMADAGAPTNPDAEVFSPQMTKNWNRFEKITLPR